MLQFTPLLFTNLTLNIPNWFFTGQALIVLLIGLGVGYLLGQVRSRSVTTTVHE
jgi:hypothetical protein